MPGFLKRLLLWVAIVEAENVRMLRSDTVREDKYRLATCSLLFFSLSEVISIAHITSTPSLAVWVVMGTAQLGPAQLGLGPQF